MQTLFAIDYSLDPITASQSICVHNEVVGFGFTRRLPTCLADWSVAVARACRKPIGGIYGDTPSGAGIVSVTMSGRDLLFSEPVEHGGIS